MIQIKKEKGIKVPMTLPLAGDSSFEGIVDRYYEMIDLDFWSVQVYDIGRLEAIISSTIFHKSIISFPFSLFLFLFFYFPSLSFLFLFSIFDFLFAFFFSFLFFLYFLWLKRHIFLQEQDSSKSQASYNNRIWCGCNGQPYLRIVSIRNRD